ncbi:MAG: 2-vinyl bacteriochlorophyllide hydratase [Oceanicaulis sp.]
MQADIHNRDRRFSPGPAGGRGVAGMVQGWIDMVAPCPWTAHAGCAATHRRRALRAAPKAPLYTPEQRKRRDESAWTIVQGVLAPLQFLVFAVSLGLVIRYLVTGEGYWIATASVVIKTFILYAIMVTGAIWEKVVFGKYLFAPAFFWEDVFSMLVLALHTAYLAAVFAGWGTSEQQMQIALAAYATYVVNAAQFIWKLRMARLEGAAS